MKWLILVLFGVAFVCSFGWYEAAERKFTQLQKTTLGVTALAAWMLVIVLGNAIL